VLTACPPWRSSATGDPTLLDLGSGGYPGLPLAIAPGRAGRPGRVGRQEGPILATVLDALELRPAAVAATRAETLAADPHHGNADVVTARAVGSLAELVELGPRWPRPAAPKSPGSGAADDELAAAERAAEDLGVAGR
jgi:16S rRNA G527 N7-methylase RsmG